MAVQILTGDAAYIGFDNGLGKFEWSDTGESLTIDSTKFWKLQIKLLHLMMELLHPVGTGVVHFKLPAVDGSSTFMSQVNLDSLETINSKEILKAHLVDVREDSPDIRVVGNVINSLPVSGTKLTLNLKDKLILWRQKKMK